MVSSGIASANALTAGLNAKTSAKAKSSSGQDFDSFLKTESLEHMDVQTGRSDNGKNENISSLKEDNAAKEYNPLESAKESNFTDVSKDVSKADEISGTTEITESVVKTDEDMEIPEEIIQAMNVLFADIVQVIVDYTGKTPDEITNAMQDLGLESADLLNNDNLNNLVTGLMGRNNIMELLTDTDMSAMIKTLVGEVNDLKNQFMDSFNLNQEMFQSLPEELSQELPKTEVLQPMEDNIVPSDMADVKETEKNPDTMIQSEISGSVDTKPDETTAVKSVSDVVAEENGTSSERLENTNRNTDSSLSGEKKNSENNAETDAHKNSVVMMSDMLDSIKSIVSEALPEDSREFVASRIVNQILDDIRMNARPDMTSLEMQLEPENLGKVTISIVTKAGHITAQIAAQNEVAKEAIESQLNVLKDNLNNQGVKVEAIEVTIASHSFEENLEKGGDSAGGQKESRNKKTISAKELAEINGEVPDEQVNEETVMEQMGATVSYLA